MQIIYLGDFDPSGINTGEKIEETLQAMASDAEILFERLAVTPERIWAWDLPTRPTTASDSRAKGFGEVSVELDAIEPQRFRRLVKIVIEELPPDQFKALKAAEESERAAIRRLVQGLGEAG